MSLAQALATALEDRDADVPAIEADADGRATTARTCLALPGSMTSFDLIEWALRRDPL